MSDVEQYVNNLRDKIARIVTNHEVWATLYGVLDALKIPYPSESDSLGKAAFLFKITGSTDEKTIINASQQIIKSYPGSRSKLSTNDIQILQDNLWWIESKGNSEISKVSRYKIAESLEKIPFWGRLKLVEFFALTLHLNAESYEGITKDGVGYIYKGWFGNGAMLSTLFSGIETKPVPISTAEFFREIGIDTWPDQRLVLILEKMVHPEVQPADSQKRILALLNSVLEKEQLEFRQEGIEGGSPVYKIRKKGIGVQGAPKYIIFASSGAKPDIIIPDTINMDIQVVKHADKCLIYDQTPTEGDLTWEMLLNWWANKQGISHPNDKTRQEFGKRLRSSLQSDPERIFFDTYFKMVKPKYGGNLPALLPQVYLHYDPRSRNERGTPILVRQRMDFLLLLRNSARVVLEIDGMQHYADETLHASTTKYAEMVAEDRRIRLLGYEIYRFGVDEIKNNDKEAHYTISTFFDNLFVRHKIAPD
jgi:very-short-patch-repair endonuclease